MIIHHVKTYFSPRNCMRTFPWVTPTIKSFLYLLNAFKHNFLLQNHAYVYLESKVIGRLFCPGFFWFFCWWWWFCFPLYCVWVLGVCLAVCLVFPSFPSDTRWHYDLLLKKLWLFTNILLYLAFSCNLYLS